MNIKKPKLFVFAGPSGVGKGSILKEFLKNNENVKYSVSSTTRKPRNIEKDGVDYFFVTESSFLNSVKNEEFLEWANYNGNYYGTNMKNVQNYLNKGYSVILEIEVQGAMQVMKKIEDCVSIFVMPPTLLELEKRLRSRQTEDDLTILNRLKIAEFELSQRFKFKYTLVNDSLMTAVNSLQEIYDKECK